MRGPPLIKINSQRPLTPAKGVEPFLEVFDILENMMYSIVAPYFCCFVDNK